MRAPVACCQLAHTQERVCLALPWPFIRYLGHILSNKYSALWAKPLLTNGYQTGDRNPAAISNSSSLLQLLF